MKYLSPKNIWKRLIAPSPTFFKRVRTFGLSITAAGIALIAFKSQYPTEMAFLPKSFGGYLLTVGVVAAFIASLPVTDASKGEVK